MKTKRHFGFVFAACFISLFMLACSKSRYKRSSPMLPSAVVTPSDCIKKAIAADDSLGTLRNHACETISLARTIRDYADGIRRIDFSSCPAGFTAAFEKHRQAWLNMIPLVEKYPDLRGEMHDLFARLEKGADAETFEPLLKAIWDTWAEIETAMKE